MEALFQAAQRISARGAFWTQGAGGNVSLKFTDPVGRSRLAIKASGRRLDAMSHPAATVEVDAASFLEKLRNLLATNPSGEQSEQGYAQILKESAESRDDGARPSMETGFHLLLDQPLVLHFHSLPSLWMAEHWFSGTPGFKQWLSASGAPLIFLDWAMPGLELCGLIERRAQGAECVLVRNHGVILACADLLALDRWEAFEREYMERWHADAPRNVVWHEQPGALNWFFPDTAVFAERLLKHLEPLEPLASKSGLASSYRPKLSLDADLDMRELWAATRQLSAFMPTLSELPTEMLAAIASLPTERFRKAGIQSRNAGVESGT